MQRLFNLKSCSLPSCQHVLVVVLALVVAGCSGLGGEPAIRATIPAATSAPVEQTFPTERPDLANGAAIFAANCTECHGPAGAGNGPLVASGQVPEPGNFSLPDTLSSRTPAEFFQVITNGRIEQLMPPWQGALSQEERWDVALYTYMLRYSAEDVTQGEAVADDANLDAQLDAAVSDLSSMMQMSDTELLDALGVETNLSDEDATALTAYTRSLAVQNADAIGQAPAEPAVTPEANAEATAEASETVTITGLVTMGTAGSSAPDGLTVTLHLFDPEFNEQTRETQANAEGVYRFEDVPLFPDWVYFTSVAYNERQFASRPQQIAPETETVELPITIYETTSDESMIRIIGLVLQAVPNASGTGLDILQVARYENSSDRIYSTEEAVGSGRTASVSMPLPANAVIQGFGGEEQRFVIRQADNTIIDTLPVLPGSDHTVEVAYFLPYDTSDQISLTLPFPFDGPVRVLFPEGELRAESRQLAPIGPQVIGGVTYNALGATLQLPAGETISLSLSDGTSAAIPPLVVAGGVILIITVIVVIAGLLVRRRQTLKVVDRDTLVAQIAALDRDYETGAVSEADYQTRRNALKRQLAGLMREDKPRAS